MALYPCPMALPLALSALQKGAAVLLFTGVLAPLVGLLLKRVGGGWETMGGGGEGLSADRLNLRLFLSPVITLAPDGRSVGDPR